MMEKFLLLVSHPDVQVSDFSLKVKVILAAVVWYMSKIAQIIIDLFVFTKDNFH